MSPLRPIKFHRNAAVVILSSSAPETVVVSIFSLLVSQSADTSRIDVTIISSANPHNWDAFPNGVFFSVLGSAVASAPAVSR